MESPDLKVLKSLADTCRKSGITSFEGFGYKFSLDLDSYKPRRRAPNETQVPEDTVEGPASWEDLSDEEKMFYSSGGFITPGSSTGAE